jgi:hypothetical protein
MKKICAMLFMLLSASASFAQHGNDAVVRWKSIVGVIATQQDTNPVSNNIDSGTFAWTTFGRSCPRQSGDWCGCFHC